MCQTLAVTGARTAAQPSGSAAGPMTGISCAGSMKAAGPAVAQRSRSATKPLLRVLELGSLGSDRGEKRVVGTQGEAAVVRSVIDMCHVGGITDFDSSLADTGKNRCGQSNARATAYQAERLRSCGTYPHFAGCVRRIGIHPPLHTVHAEVAPPMPTAFSASRYAPDYTSWSPGDAADRGASPQSRAEIDIAQPSTT